MKKIIWTLLALLSLPVIGKTEPLAVETKAGTFFIPLQVVKATQLYAPDLGKGFPGIETVIYEKERYQLTFGAAPVIGTSVNVPFFGVQRQLSEKLFDVSNNDLYFGVWTGKPSDKPGWTWGVKASVSLW